MPPGSANTFVGITRRPSDEGPACASSACKPSITSGSHKARRAPAIIDSEARWIWEAERSLLLEGGRSRRQAGCACGPPSDVSASSTIERSVAEANRLRHHYLGTDAQGASARARMHTVFTEIGENASIQRQLITPLTNGDAQHSGWSAPCPQHARSARSCARVAMAEQLLHCAQVVRVAIGQGGRRVAQCLVRHPRPLEFGPREIAADREAHPARGESAGRWPDCRRT